MRTNEQRLARLERFAKLFVNAGRSERRKRNELRENINYVVNLQINNEEKFARNEDRFARNEERIRRLIEAQARTDLNIQKLTQAQAQTDLHGKVLIETQRTLVDFITRGHNGAR